MKRIFLAFSLLFSLSPAYATPVYLTCKDKSATEVKTYKQTSKPDKITSKSEPITRKIYLDINSNRATLMQMNADLDVEPETIRLTKVIDDKESQDSNYSTSSFLRIYNMTINRASLSYNYKYTGNYNSRWDMSKMMQTSDSILRSIGAPTTTFVSSSTEGKASGICTKTAAPANNQV